MKNLTWNTIDWKTVSRRVFKLQKEIYKQSKLNNIEEIHRLQLIMINSIHAKMLAVRRVTQDNRGKNTAGLDGVKSLTPKQRIHLVQILCIDGKSDSIKRVWIPKSTPGELRPLGIPTLRDRAKQALALLALEPEWEARFEPNSYGFRPGRSCQDAIKAIHLFINKKTKFVLEADIAKCFDRINHDALLAKMNSFPEMEKQVKAWLKAGILDQGVRLFPEEGTPQGGVISPLLANIALHGMEEFLKEWINQYPMKDSKGYSIRPRDRKLGLNLVRYADDFVILHENLEVVEESKRLLVEWLKPMGLEFKESKTRIVHTLKEFQGYKPGFDFLGFTVRQYHVGKYRRGKKGLLFKTLITPSRRSVRRHLDSLRDKLKHYRNQSTGAMISALSPIIRGWCNYHRTVVSSGTFTYCERVLMRYLFSWAQKKHPLKPKKWIFDTYLKRIWVKDKFGIKIGRSRLQFGYDLNGTWIYLWLHTTVKIKRHIKIIGDRSPYDGNLVYWSLRNRVDPTLSTRTTFLLQRQKGCCNLCHLYFNPNDIMEIDHMVPLSRGGKDTLDNLQLLHGHCHDVKSRSDSAQKNN